MVKNIDIPSLVIKEKILREKKEDKSFTWLVCLENHYTRSFKLFEFVASLIDKNKDTIIGFHSWQLEHNKELEDNFEQLATKLKVKNRKFLSVQKDPNTSIGKSICNIVNFGDDYIDFVSIGHNPSKYEDIEKSPTLEIIKYA